MSADEPLWTATEVARYLNVSKSWVEHVAPAGGIPSVMIGRMRRFVPDEIRKFARSGAPKPTTRSSRS